MELILRAIEDLNARTPEREIGTPNTAFQPAMMLTLPFAVYGIFRYLYLIHVKGEGGAPDEVVFKDKPLLINGA